MAEKGVEEGKVIIKREALVKMLTHMYRFGSEILDNNSEVFGVCLGTFKPDEIIMEVQDVLPILHGDEVELGFSKEINMMLDGIKKEYETDEIKVIGWYLSHLGNEYEVNYSNSDKFNQTYFQTKENPLGFCIVIDNSRIRIEENFGINVYRLANPSKGVGSDYLNVNFTLEKPNSLEYFKWVQKFVEEAQKEDSNIITEFIEKKKPKPEELQEIPTSEEKKGEDGTEDVKTEKLLDGLKEGTLKFNEHIINTYSNEFETWMKDVSNGALEGVEKIRSSINQMNNTVLVGLEDVDRFFEKSFIKKTSLFENSVKNDFSDIYKTQENHETEISEILKNLSQEYKESLLNNFQDLNGKLNEKISNLEVRLHNVNQTTVSFKNQLDIIDSTISESLKETNSLSEEIIKSIENANNNFEKNIKFEIDNLDLNSEEIAGKNKEIEDLIDRLQKVISDFRQLK